MMYVLFVFYGCMLIECEGARVTAMLVWVTGRCVDEYVGGTRGLGILYSAADVLGMRGVGIVCELCMCLARGGV